MKDIFNKCQRFSIRKLSFGVVSALLGAVLFGTPQEVLASTENNLTSSIEPSSEIVNSITTVEKKEEVQNNSENRDNVSDPAPKDMSGVATRTAELREPGDKENNRTVKPTFVSGRDRSSNLETRASAPSSDIKKYELTEEYAKQIKSGEIGLEENKLDSLLLNGSQLNPNGFTDDDFLSDKDEIYIYEKNGKKYVGYNSHPLLEDTDGDGIIDSKEKPDEKLKWNVSERDMIMFMELAYREDNYIDRVLDYKRPLSESELFKRAGDKKPRYEYMMMNKELGPYWKRKKSYHTSSGLDAVLFETKSDFPFLPNGTAQVLAFRGTSDAKDIKADVTLGIGGNPQQGIDAENIISELAKDKSITNLYLTGHSLGGYLVQRAMVEAYQLAYSNNRVMSTQENVAYRNFYNNILKKGTTFNAPKVVTSLVSNREFWKKGLDSKKIAQSGKMTHYIVDNDQTIKKDVSNDSDVVINVGATSGRHSSRSYFENNMINIRPEFISGKRVSLDRTGYQDKNISTIKSVEKVGEKIVYSKNGDDIFKSTTISMRDSDTGEVTEKVTNEIFKKDGAKNKVETTEIPSLKKYVKDDRREKGQENITILGKAGSKTTTTAYTVNPETGEVTPNVGKPVIVAPTTTVIKVAAKDKVVYSKEGNNIVKATTTYKVDPDNGNITENTIKEIFKENGLKDKVDVETIQSPVKYVKDTTREKGQENITVLGKAGSKTTTTTYTVNSETGEVTPNVGKPVIVAPTTTVIKVAAKDKVVYSKEGNNIVKATTTYKVDPDNGNITENTTKETFNENGLKDKVDVETIQSPVKYVKDTTREKGQENITIPGKAGSKTTTTTYTVNPETGEVTELVGTPEVKNATETVVKVAAKDKVEVVQRENGKKVKVTTVYMVDEKTGNITQTEREEEISSEVITSKSEEKVPTVELKPFEGGVNPAESVVTEELKPFEGGVNPAESVVTEELKPFEGGVNPAESVVTEELKPSEGGVNPAESVVTEELPELKVALLRDEEGNILDVLAISEKQKELKGYKYTGKEEVDDEGNKIYTYQKDNSEVVTSKPEEKVPTIELKPFEGGVNPAESVVTEELKPFEGGVNPAESVVTEELKPFEGGVNSEESVVTEELKPFEGGANPVESVVTEELKPFEGGVNVEIPAVKEELPELKLALLKDEEGDILDVLAISEKPKELNGYKYTGKEKVDSEGNKIYIYKKVGLNTIQTVEQDTIVANQSQVLKENIENKTEITTDRNDKKTVDKILPNTGEKPLEHGVLGGMLLAATMILAKRKVKK